MDTRGDQLGNRVGQTDAYGKPVHGTTTDQTPMQQTHHTTIDGGAQHGHQAQMMRPTTEPQGVTTLPRSGSGSSSSSEDDGVGGRRKKGLKEKIKEKLPGGHKTDGEHGQAQAQMPGYGVAQPAHEKKGVGEKIKETLPGGHGQPQTHGTAGYGGGAGNTATGGGYGGATHVGSAEQHEKKGMAEKIKENLPGGHGQPQTHGTTGHGGAGTTAATGGGGYGGTNPTATGTTHVPTSEQQEKKGMMEKIKEKLPGGNR